MTRRKTTRVIIMLEKTGLWILRCLLGGLWLSRSPSSSEPVSSAMLLWLLGIKVAIAGFDGPFASISVEIVLNRWLWMEGRLGARLGACKIIADKGTLHFSFKLQLNEEAEKAAVIVRLQGQNGVSWLV
jgi:hypothetical protein